MSQTINRVPHADLNQNLELMGSQTDIDEATSILVMGIGDDFCGDKLVIIFYIQKVTNIKVSPS